MERERLREQNRGSEMDWEGLEHIQCRRKGSDGEERLNTAFEQGDLRGAPWEDQVRKARSLDSAGGGKSEVDWVKLFILEIVP